MLQMTSDNVLQIEYRITQLLGQVWIDTSFKVDQSYAMRLVILNHELSQAVAVAY